MVKIPISQRSLSCTVMPSYYYISRLFGGIIVLCLFVSCAHAQKPRISYAQAMNFLKQAKRTSDFKTREAYTKAAVEAYPSNWLSLKNLYLEQAHTQKKLKDRVFYLEQAIKTVTKYSTDYHSIGIHRELGELYYQHNYIKQSLRRYKKLMEVELKYVNQKQDNEFFFKSLFNQYLDDCLNVGKIYLDSGDKTSALHYFTESRKYFNKLQERAYKDKALSSYLADKFFQLGQIYEELGLSEDMAACYEMGIKFRLLDLESRINSKKPNLNIEKELKNIIGFGKIDKGKEIKAEQLWARFLLAKYYYRQDLREPAVDYITQVLDSDFESLANVGNIMTILRYIPWKFIFSRETRYDLQLLGQDQTLLEVMLKKYHAIGKSFYKRFGLEDLHSWLFISLLVEDYADIRLISKRMLELKPKPNKEKKFRLWNIILHNIGVVYYRKAAYRRAEFYLKKYHAYAGDSLSTFNLAMVYLTMNEFNKARPLLLKYKEKYPDTLFSDTVQKYLEDSDKYLAAGNADFASPLELKQSIMPILK